jgi:hypothetical protein
MKKLKIVAGIVVPLLLLLALAVPAAANVLPPVEPPEVTAELDPGSTLTVAKSVAVPEIPPLPDIYFLADTTGSMIDVIETVAANADAIMDAILLEAPNAQFGVGNYKDFPYDPYAFDNQLNITDDTAAVAAAINDWVTVAGGGGDWPEGQFYALTQIVDPGVGWRADSSKIVVWIGDSPAHDPVPMAATGLLWDITETTVTDALVAAGISVIAISLNTGTYPDGLDDDPMLYGGDYAAAYGITEDGTLGQASRIAAATGGVYLFAATPEEAVAAITAGLQALSTDVWWTVEADPGLTVTLDPAVRYDVLSGTTVGFDETIEVTADPSVSTTFNATVTFWANSYPEAGAVIGEETITITVMAIDIKPWSCPNSINPKSNGVVPVAILGSDTFDVTTVDVTTLEFGPNGATPAHDLTDPDVYADHIQDVNGDGWMDLVSHYAQKDTGLAVGMLAAELTGELLDGTVFSAWDSVRVLAK